MSGSKSNQIFSTPYRHLSKVYDQMQADRFSARMAEYTIELLRKLKRSPKRVFDLCCGTGTASVLFAERGLEVVGLDRSQDMLKIARKKIDSKKLAVRLYRRALPRFDLPQNLPRFDLAVSYYDSLNYQILKNDLQRTFRGVHNLLEPRGIFIFDMNTAWTLENIWTRTNARVREDSAWFWKAEYRPAKKIAELQTTMFVKKNNRWDRFDELHVERGYEISELEQMLRQAGMKVLAVYDCFKFVKPTEETPRIALVAQRV